MSDRQKTTIHPTTDVHRLASRLSDMSGMSLTAVYALGALNLCARHARALEHGAKRAHLLREIREAFEDELQKVEQSDP